MKGTHENAVTVPGVMHVQVTVRSWPPHRIPVDSLLLLKLRAFLVLGGDLAVTIGLHFHSLALNNLADLRENGDGPTANMLCHLGQVLSPPPSLISPTLR